MWWMRFKAFVNVINIDRALKYDADLSGTAIEAEALDPTIDTEKQSWQR